MSGRDRGELVGFRVALSNQAEWMDGPMSSSLVDTVKRLIEMKVVVKGDEAKALSVVEQLQPNPHQMACRQVAGALRTKNLITAYQADTIARNQTETLRQGKYVIFDKLGTGGVGMVFKARHHLTSAVVALKMVYASSAKNPDQDDEKSLQRFLREIENLGKIDSKHVVKVYDSEWDDTNKQFYLVMECIDGVDLHTRVIQKIKNQERLSLTESCRQILQAAQGLKAAHAKEIVHRDIKPSNLMISFNDNIVKVVDFGMARAKGNLTVTKGIVGTAAFLAPEQAFQSKVDHRADIYSLGCTLYFLCTGEFLYSLNDPMAFIYNHIHTPAPQLKAKRPHTPEWLENLFQKMVAKRPEDRFQSADDLITTLESRVRKPTPTISVNTLTSNGSEIQISPTLPPLKPEPKAGDQTNNNSLKIEMIWCPPGNFTMGSPKDEKGRDSDEDQVEITLTQGFWLGKYPVTQSQWRKVMGNLPGGAAYGEGPNHPVYSVSWEESQEFCKRYTESERQAGRLTDGLAYELPTEAQWEYACRAGSTTRFCFGDDKAKLDECAWYYGNNKGQTHEVGQKQPNAWGLYDMHGHVWEWCRDWYVGELGGGVDPVGPQSGSDRAYRGGGWSDEARYCRSASRNGGAPDDRNGDLGFRLALVR